MKPQRKIKDISFRKFDSMDIVSFRKDLSESELCRNPPDSLDLLVDLYNDTLSDLVDKYAPLETKPMVVREMQPWFNSDIKEAKQERRKLERKSKRTKAPDDEVAFKHQKNKVNFMLKSARTNFFSDLIKKNGSNQKALFKTLLCFACFSIMYITIMYMSYP